jgi:hypothetical protein
MRARVAMEMGVAKSCTVMVMWMRVGVGGLCREAGWVMAGGKHERFAYVMSCLAAELEHNDSKPQTTTTTLLFAAPFRADDTQPIHAVVTAVSLKDHKSHEAGKSGGGLCHMYRDCNSAA